MIDVVVSVATIVAVALMNGERNPRPDITRRRVGSGGDERWRRR
ncbi:hypothetical protein IWX75_000027 [Arthrobacter sp. CAN_A6]